MNPRRKQQLIGGSVILGIATTAALVATSPAMTPGTAPTASPTVPATALPAPTVTVTAPSRPSATVTVTATPSASDTSDACRAAGKLAKDLGEAVFAYSRTTSPENDAINQALKGIAMDDIQTVNKAVKQLNEITSERTEPVQRITSLYSQLTEANERCTG